jgi:hypothetical protein
MLFFLSLSVFVLVALTPSVSIEMRRGVLPLPAYLQQGTLQPRRLSALLIS